MDVRKQVFAPYLICIKEVERQKFCHRIRRSYVGHWTDEESDLNQRNYDWWINDKKFIRQIKRIVAQIMLKNRKMFDGGKIVQLHMQKDW